MSSSSSSSSLLSTVSAVSVVTANVAMPGTARDPNVAFGARLGLPPAPVTGTGSTGGTDDEEEEEEEEEGAVEAFLRTPSQVSSRWSFRVLVSGTIAASAISACNRPLSSLRVTLGGSGVGTD